MGSKKIEDLNVSGLAEVAKMRMSQDGGSLLVACQDIWGMGRDCGGALP